MKSYRITINNQHYCGEAAETYKTNEGSGGWHPQNHGELEKLKFSNHAKDGKIIESALNLKSDLEKIMKRERDGEINIKEMVIFEVKKTTKPKPEDYGFHQQSGFDDEPSGWCLPEGKEEYEKALKA